MYLLLCTSPLGVVYAKSPKLFSKLPNMRVYLLVNDGTNYI